MTDKEKNRIEKFLELHYGNLELTTTREGKYKSLSHIDDKSTIFLLEQTNLQIFLDSKKVIDPIFSMFNTEYSETYDFVKDWVKKKYNLDCIDFVGV